MRARRGSVAGMKRIAALLLMCLAACGQDRPPAPTAEENRQLDEAEAMLNESSNQLR